MFTGIIEELGLVRNFSRRTTFSLLEVNCQKILEDTKKGDSIAINGACLTVLEKKPPIVSFEIMPETLKKTTLGDLKANSAVNLERALKFGDRLSGHFVSGHIDCIGLIKDKANTAEGIIFEIKVPVEFMPFIIAKGSVAVDGISLTIVQRKASSFTVSLIPHTLNNTTLKYKSISDKVNVECDMFAKYAKAALTSIR